MHFVEGRAEQRTAKAVFGSEIARRQPSEMAMPQSGH